MTQNFTFTLALRVTKSCNSHIGDDSNIMVAIILQMYVAGGVDLYIVLHLVMFGVIINKK